MTEASKQKIVELECSIIELEAQKEELINQLKNKKGIAKTGKVLSFTALLFFSHNLFNVENSIKQDLFLFSLSFLAFGIIIWLFGITSSEQLNKCKKKILDAKLELVRFKYKAMEA